MIWNPFYDGLASELWKKSKEPFFPHTMMWLAPFLHRQISTSLATFTSQKISWYPFQEEVQINEKNVGLWGDSITPSQKASVQASVIAWLPPRTCRGQRKRILPLLGFESGPYIYKSSRLQPHWLTLSCLSATILSSYFFHFFLLFMLIIELTSNTFWFVDVNSAILFDDHVAPKITLFNNAAEK